MPRKLTVSVKPFKIKTPQSVLDDLQSRLGQARWTDEVRDANWGDGTNLNYLKRLTAYWHTSFDWRKQEKELNKFSSFTASVDGMDIHFVHERGKGPDPTPLILIHGWPDSFYRFHKIIPMLTDPAAFGGDASQSFDVIVPSLPGMGFSGHPTERGWNMRRSAETLGKLMTEVLGYKAFVASGGDGGSVVSQVLGILHPKIVQAIYITDLGYQATSNLDPATLTPEEQKFLQASQMSSFQEGAYAMLQMTKPQSLAFGLNDSPVGLAAWILEKFQSWSDCGGDVEKRFTKDELLTNIMIYWVTQTIGSSLRSYREDLLSPSLKPGERVTVPVGVGVFPHDLFPAPPRHLGERTLNVKHWVEIPRGGHFTAWEEPELLAKELRTFFARYRV
jgi:pimeloyl-ACP methyl ester carboxylesterase